MSDVRDDDIDGFFSTARTSGRDEAVQLGGEGYRDHLFPLDDESLAPWRGMDAEQFTAARQDNPFLQQLLADWNALLAEPFSGVTTDGSVVAGLYPLPDAGDDTVMVAAAEHLLDVVGDDDRASLVHDLDDRSWRAWSNPEFIFHRVGLRLEDQPDAVVRAVLDLVAATLSPAGYARVTEAMQLNGFLGELTDLPQVLNDRSYWFALYGTPGLDEAWGWQLFGHHVAVHAVTVAGRHVIAPQFIGAEPALSDGERPPLFDAREQLALRLAASLTDAQRAQAVVYDSVLDPSMPEGRLHPADERHVAGAFRDNRVVPYEGIRAGDLTDDQRALLREIVADVHGLLRDDQHAQAMALYDAHLDDTWFAWYGATDGSQPIYFRIQSPVVLAELDNHAGVWLSNRLPARFHVHSTLRLPNGGDYGRALLAQWRASRGLPVDASPAWPAP